MRQRWWLVGAGIWSAGLVLAAAVVPAYSSTSVSTSSSSAPGVLGNSAQTLLQVNGPPVLVPLSLPFLAVVAVALLLPKHPRLAGAVTVLVLVFCLLGMLTVGVFVLPVAILLAVACSRPAAAR